MNQTKSKQTEDALSRHPPSRKTNTGHRGGSSSIMLLLPTRNKIYYTSIRKKRTKKDSNEKIKNK